ncbi:tetratricopeptide repeat protein [Planctomycetota bacterium]|nr:tetratricopeptide repeat protein [Planctomycetota bacterium]
MLVNFGYLVTTSHIPGRFEFMNSAGFNSIHTSIRSISFILSVCLLSVLLFVTGCVSSRAREMGPSSDTTINTPLNFPLSHSEEVTIEVVRVNHAEWDTKAMTRAVKRFKRHIPGRIKLNTKINIDLPMNMMGEVTTKALNDAMNDIATQSEHVGPATILLLIVPEVSDVDELGLYKPITVTLSDKSKTATNSIIIMTSNIEYYGKNIRYMTNTETWEYTIYRELCRSLGLPHRSNHIYAKGQCTRLNCILHPTFDPLLTGYGKRALRPAKELCDDCLAEAYFHTRSQPTPLLNPKRKITSIEWYDRLVEANPNHPEALVMRYNALVKDKQYLRAMEDIKNAYLNSFDDPIITNIYAQYLAECPEKSLQNPSRALALALSLNQMTNYKDVDFLMTLAGTYEALGDTKRALEYYEKIKALQKEVHVKKRREPAFYHPYGN